MPIPCARSTNPLVSPDACAPHRHPPILQTKPVDTSTLYAHESELVPGLLEQTNLLFVEEEIPVLSAFLGSRFDPSAGRIPHRRAAVIQKKVAVSTQRSGCMNCSSKRLRPHIGHRHAAQILVIGVARLPTVLAGSFTSVMYTRLLYQSQ